MKQFRKNILTWLLPLFFFAACKQDTVREYNDYLVAYKNSVDSNFIYMNKYIDMALQEKEYSLINYLTDMAIDSMKIKMEQLKVQKAPDNGTEFRDALVNYTQSLINTSKAYKSYLMLSDSTLTVLQIDSLQNSIKAEEDRINRHLQLVISAQKEFAGKENLKLE